MGILRNLSVGHFPNVPLIRTPFVIFLKFGKIAHASQTRTNSLTCFKIGQNRTLASPLDTSLFNQQNWPILHPAGRFHFHFDSLRSTTIQPCTWFAGIPEAPYHSAFSKGFSFFSFIFFGATGEYATLPFCERRI